MEYEADRRFCYLANPEDYEMTGKALAQYRLSLDREACIEIHSYSGSLGYLCGLASTGARDQEERHTPGEADVGDEKSQIRIEVSPGVVTAGDILRIRVVNLDATAIDVLYSIDEQDMPPIHDWLLGEEGGIIVLVDETTRKGLYRLKAVRSSMSEDENAWITADAQVRVK